MIVTLVLTAAACTIETSPAPSPTPSPTTTSTTPAGLPCGAVDIGCNCVSTSAGNGQVTTAPRCQSGYHQFQLCTGSCNPGYPWQTACYCY